MNYRDINPEIHTFGPEKRDDCMNYIQRSVFNENIDFDKLIPGDGIYSISPMTYLSSTIIEDKKYYIFNSPYFKGNMVIQSKEGNSISKEVSEACYEVFKEELPKLYKEMEKFVIDARAKKGDTTND